MSYDNEVVKVCRLSNGWEVEVYDPSPAEEKAEKKAATKGEIAVAAPYRSPWRSLAFKTWDEVIKFLGAKGGELKPRNFDDEYAKAFNDTVASMGGKKGKK